jgi:hypothetical protein
MGPGQCEADDDEDHFGHSMARWTAALFPNDINRRKAAAEWLGGNPQSAQRLIREDLPLAIARVTPARWRHRGGDLTL